MVTPSWHCYRRFIYHSLVHRVQSFRVLPFGIARKLKRIRLRDRLIQNCFCDFVS